MACKTSQRQGSRSSETGQYPARVTLSVEFATDPNSKIVIPDTGAGRVTSTAPFMPGTSGLCWVSGSGLDWDGDGGVLEPFHQERIPIASVIWGESVAVSEFVGG